jgi:transposase
MLSLPSSVRIYFFESPADMRKGFDGLAALVRASGLDVFSGHLFVFVSHRGDRVKVLSWERGGFVLWYKRLERGRFRRPVPQPGCERVEIEPDQLVLLLEGIDFSRVRRPRRWEPKRDRQPETLVI